MTEQLLEGLDAEQAAAVRAVRGRVAIVAGAGSGKTRTVTRRIAYAVATGAQLEEHGLAVAFNQRAAAEIKSRLAELSVHNVTTSTIHAAALRQLTYFWPKVMPGSAWKVLANKQPYIGEIAASRGMDLSASQIRELVAQIDVAKANGHQPDSFHARFPDLSDVVDVWRDYENLCLRRKVLDFDDVLSTMVGMIAARPDVAEEIRRRYTWFTVDEFQDISPLQQSLIAAWLGDRDDICVVGDPLQTIYSYAGGTATFLESELAREDSTVIHLSTTYRVPQTIADAALAAVGEQAHGRRLRSAHTSDSSFSVLECATRDAEIQAVVAHIEHLKTAGEDLRSIACLVRTNAAIPPLEQALEAAGIACVVKTGQSYLQHPAAKKLLLTLRVGEIIPRSALTLNALVHETAVALGWSPSDVPTGFNERLEWEAVSAIVAQSRDVMRENPEASLEDFFEKLALFSVASLSPQADAVSLLTMHAAKGLEWKHVVLPHVSAGTMPHVSAISLAEKSEEARLLYVAMTRTSSTLCVTYSGEISPFIDGVTVDDNFVVPSVSKPENVDSDAVAARRLVKCRNCAKGLSQPAEVALEYCLGCTPTPDENVRAALIAWRESFAALSDSLSWLVLSDLSVAALAIHKPRSLDELGAIHGMTSAKVAEIGSALIEVIESALQP